jgi:thiamine biosynthesis lipoprotein
MIPSGHQSDGLAVFRREAVPSTATPVGWIAIPGNSRRWAEVQVRRKPQLAGPTFALLARQTGLDALFLLREVDGSAGGVGIGRLFSEEPAAIASAEGK